MSKQYYEAHITMDGDPDAIKEAVEGAGWTFSKIDGDIVMGEGVKCYATSHFNEREWDAAQLASFAEGIAKGLEMRAGCVVRRVKIELVVYDTRSVNVRPKAEEVEDDSQIPETSAALIIHEDGTPELWMPKLSGDDEAPVPDNTLVITALAKFIRDEVSLGEIIDGFAEEGAVTVSDKDGVLAKAPGEYNTWEKRIWRRGFYAGQQDSGEVAQSGSAQGS